MPYQEMYALLFNAITEALADLEMQNVGLARERLIRAQLRTEAMYMEEE